MDTKLHTPARQQNSPAHEWPAHDVLVPWLGGAARKQPVVVKTSIFVVVLSCERQVGLDCAK